MGILLGFVRLFAKRTCIVTRRRLHASDIGGKYLAASALFTVMAGLAAFA